jgi:hypothetical protein
MEVCASDGCRVGVEDANIVNDDDEENDDDDDKNACGWPDMLLFWSDPVDGRVENADTRRFRRMMNIVWEGNMAKIIMDAAKVIMVDATSVDSPLLKPTRAGNKPPFPPPRLT